MKTFIKWFLTVYAAFAAQAYLIGAVASKTFNIANWNVNSIYWACCFISVGLLIAFIVGGINSECSND